MAMKLATAFVEVEARGIRGVGRSFAGLRASIGRTIGSMGNLIATASKVASRIALIGGGLALGGLVIGANRAVAAAERQIDAEARLAAVIRATGGAAGFTAKEMEKFASELQSRTTVGDEAIMESMAVLSTFKNISGDAFKGATESILDMAAAMETDAKSAALQLGKALNDPAARVSDLSRAGITFTEAQKEQIKVLQESGDLLGAQAIILKEVKSEFGGVAAAMALTPIGRMKQITNIIGDLQEEIGKKLLPIMLRFKEIWLVIAKEVTSVINSLIDKYGEMALEFGDWIQVIVTNWRSLLSALTDGTFQFGAVIGEFLLQIPERFAFAFGAAARLVVEAFKFILSTAKSAMLAVWDIIRGKGAGGFAEAMAERGKRMGKAFQDGFNLDLVAQQKMNIEAIKAGFNNEKGKALGLSLVDQKAEVTAARKAAEAAAEARKEAMGDKVPEEVKKKVEVDVFAELGNGFVGFTDLNRKIQEIMFKQDDPGERTASATESMAEESKKTTGLLGEISERLGTAPVLGVASI